MSESVLYRDFSAIHLSGTEEKLLRELCETPQKRKKEDVSEEAERLAELGLIEVYENTNTGRKGLFATALGKAYAEYSIRQRRAKRVDLAKWIAPLAISIIALVLAVAANVSGGNAAESQTSAVTYRQPSTVTSTASPRPANTTQPSSQAQTQPVGGASGDPSGEASGG